MSTSNLCTHCGVTFQTIQALGTHRRHRHPDGFRSRKSNPLYQTWRDMHRRCYDQKNHEFHNYGGRGIVVCERWRDPEALLSDMGPRPKGMTLDRINNDGPYAPDNCRWVTLREQSRNTRRSVIIHFNGRSLCLKDWAKELGIHYMSLHQRILRYGVEAAFAMGGNCRPDYKRRAMAAIAAGGDDGKD